MDIAGQRALFHLSPSGRQALRNLIPKRTSFPALVVGADQVGAWVILGQVWKNNSRESVPMVLVKWDYIATALIEVAPEAAPTRRPIGFRVP